MNPNDSARPVRSAVPQKASAPLLLWGLSIVSCAVAAMSVVAVGQIKGADSKFVMVSAAELVQIAIADAANTAPDVEQARAQARANVEQVQARMDAYAREQGVVILAREAVVAGLGVPDITDHFKTPVRRAAAGGALVADAAGVP
jgi:hypothetical protein